ncbi:MAG: holo-ACP synthase [Caldilineaceae bacterium]|nr:holo-ACP synthase [Caldilineaceae bacterium]
MLYSGVDLVEIARIWAAIVRHKERFLTRVFTEIEIAQCHERAESLAARFAAKEATAKALGTGIWRHNIAWTSIEVVRLEHGAPILHLHDAALLRAQLLGWSTWTVSLSHDRDRAIAFVVALSDPTISRPESASLLQS